MLAARAHARTDRAHQRAVHEHLLAARLQRRTLQRHDHVADVKVHDVVDLVRCAVEQAALAGKLAARRVLLDQCRRLGGQARDEDIAKLVAGGDSVVVERQARRQVPRRDVIRKLVQLVVGLFVFEVVHGLLQCGAPWDEA